MKIQRDVPYYSTGGIQPIEVIKAKCTPEMFRGYLFGNVVKYLLRHQFKGKPIEDLQKAQTYITWLIEELQDGN